MPINTKFKYWDENKVILCVSTSLISIDRELDVSIASAIKPREFVVSYGSGNSKIDVLNEVTDRALKEKCDYIFFVDPDMSFPKNAIKELLMHDVDIVSGLYHLRYPPFVPVAGWINGRGQVNGRKRKWDKDYYQLPKGKLVIVHWVGAGCLLVKTNVFKKLGKPYWEDKVNKNGNRVIGHDIWFCNQARKAGYKIYVDTSIDCLHRASVMIGREFAETYNQCTNQP